MTFSVNIAFIALGAILVGIFEFLNCEKHAKPTINFNIVTAPSATVVKHLDQNSRQANAA